MDILTKFSKELEEHTSWKSFQHLDIFIRDHSDVDPSKGSYDDCIQAGQQQKILLETSDGMSTHTSEVKNCFESFGITCLSIHGYINTPTFLVV